MSEITELLQMYRAMCRIRKVEERLSALHKAGDIPGFIHSSMGQESVAVGISRYLTVRDTIAVTHRGHAQSIAKGLALSALFAELMGREAGTCRGLGGSMHIADSSIGLLGANGIVGGSLPIAAGSALAHKLDGAGNLAVAYFGDGALAEGIFHECINLCALWSLPCLFLCENNGWSEFSPSDEQFSGDLKKFAAAFNVAYHFTEGLDVSAVTQMAEHIIDAIRTTSKPQVFEVSVERFHGHYEGDAQAYRDPVELAAARARDPIAHLREHLLAFGIAASILAQIDVELTVEIEIAVNVARASPVLSTNDAFAMVYAS
ncbi:MAG: thiamine pyrophosphate-dependent dehydrogenase E1 component subunit alpha [Proteobacteria bacterium]|nr:thiamine pyrophosphate-dependent dehydrogenase E1 component subunit alpha [Pseudomonadota bacterium]